MTNRRMSFLIALLMSAALPIQGAAGEQLDEDFILRQLARVQREVGDFTADLVQEKRISLLQKEIISHGIIQYKRPDKLLIELFDPDPSLMILDGHSLWLYFKREKVAQRYSLGSNPLFRSYLSLFDQPFDGRWGKLASVRREGDLVVLDFIPGEADAIFSKVTLWVSTEDWFIRRLLLSEKNGDSTVLSYDNIRVNTGIPDSRFRVDLPDDVEILQPSL